MRKYGIAGAAAMLGVSAADVEQAMAQGNVEDLDQKYAEGGKVNTDDELERAILLRDLELMAEERSPDAVPAQDPSLLNVGGVGDRLALINKYFNPVEAIGGAMRAGSRMMSPDVSGYDRVAALGDMLSGVAGVAGPAAVAKRVGAPAANAVMDALVGGSPTSEALSDMARKYATDESGALRLYHGSPHDFDRFSMSKIGTGEGAQAYGRGLYFAENEGVARGYQRALAGKAISSGDPVSNAWDMIYRVGGNDPQMRDAVRQAFIDMMEDADPRTAEFARRSVEAIDSGAIDAFKAPGRMYEVQINANPEDFIDWDRPLIEQPRVMAALVDEKSPPMQKSGQGHAGLLFNMPTEPGEIEAKALAAGFPGVRYLDAGSRGMGYEIKLSNKGKPYETEPIMARSRKDAERIASEYREKGFGADIQQAGSRNYVIFDENLINIVRKYGIAGAAAALGVSQAEVAQAMAQSGSSQYDPDAIEATAARVRENKFAAGGAVKYDPGAVDRIITKLREVNRG